MHSFYGTRLSDNMAETPEGYLICYDVNIARIGTQEYLGQELGVEDEVIIVNRPPEEVFKPATVASFEGKPFTNEHPYDLLDVSNAYIYEKGHIQNVRISGDKTYIIADIIVTDNQTIADIKNGKRELSAGYNCDCIKDENGNWYQCNIVGNHVALVNKGRAGAKVRINDENNFEESKHPRDKDGKFTSGGSSNSGSSSKSGETSSQNKNPDYKYIESILEKNYESGNFSSVDEKELKEKTGFELDDVLNVIEINSVGDDYDIDEVVNDLSQYANLRNFLNENHSFTDEELRKKTNFAAQAVKRAIDEVGITSGDYSVDEVISRIIEQDAGYNYRPKEEENFKKLQKLAKKTGYKGMSKDLISELLHGKNNYDDKEIKEITGFGREDVNNIIDSIADGDGNYEPDEYYNERKDYYNGRREYYNAHREAFDEEPERWITTKTGAHIPVYSGETNEKAIKNFIEQGGGGYSEYNESNRMQIARAQGKGTKKELAEALGITQKEAEKLYSNEWHHKGKSFKKENVYPIEAYKDLKEKGQISQRSIEKYELNKIDIANIEQTYKRIFNGNKKTNKELLAPYIEKYKNNSKIQEVIAEALNPRLKKVGLPAQEIRQAVEDIQNYGNDYDNSNYEERIAHLSQILSFYASRLKDVIIKTNNSTIKDIETGKFKEKKMNDKKTVLGKLFKAFAKDAEPEEIAEVVNSVQGEDEAGDDRIAKLEAQVAALTAKLDKLYSAEKHEEQGEMHSLDELEQEITDEEEKVEEIKDEDANNDPKLIEATAEKAQEDEDTTEEIKKEIADAKKVIAKIEDKATRLAVADTLATIIRGKIKSSNNYKKLMDASRQKSAAETNVINYNDIFKKIKEEKFRK